MSAGTLIEVRPQAAAPAPVEVRDGRDLQVRYEDLAQQVMRTSRWLMSPEADLLSEAAWNAHFDRYKADLEQLRRLGDELRPTTLRGRMEPLTGDALVCEITELFAA
jgi:hypothetical protein